MPRKDNGLHASTYSLLVDVESHVVDGVLEHLRSHEIAAYVAPADGRRGPYGDTVLPVSPSDSVYVDNARRDTARDLVDRYLADVRDELAWAGIVAGFDRESTAAVAPWPASEDILPVGEVPGAPDAIALNLRALDPQSADPDHADPDHADPDRGDPDADHAGSSRNPQRRAADTTIGFEELRGAVRDAEGHFEPPPPPPLPTIDTISRFAWAAVLGGPLLLIIGTVLRLDLGGWPGLLGLGAFVGGFVTLVARMKDRPPADLGGDDGAVV